MSVLLFSSEYKDSCVGGAGTHVINLVKQLKQIIPLELRYFSKAAFRTRIEPHRTLVATEEDITLLRSLTSATELVHCHTWYTFLAGILAKRILNKKLITTFHSVEKTKYWRKNLPSSNFNLWIEQEMCLVADHLIAVSDSCKRDLIECYDADPSKITVINNGVDPLLFNTELDEQLIEAWGIESHRPTIVAVSRLAAEKGIDFLLEALPYFSLEWQIVLCIIPFNKSPTNKLHEQFIHTIANLNRPVIWLSEFIPQEQVKNLYLQARVFISTAHQEPFGLSVAEAIASGCPVVARATGGIIETLEKTKGGILCDLTTSPREYAKIVDEFLNEQTYQKHTQTANPHALHHWADIATETITVYERVLQRSLV